MLSCTPGAAAPQRAAPTPSSFRPIAGPPTIPQRGWASVTNGTGDHVCVTVGSERDYRSGDFVGGGWPGFVDGWRKYGRSKMGWIPRDPTQGPLHIVGSRAGGGSYHEDLGFAISYLPSGDYFWPGGPNVSRAGRWTFTLTAGHESGCFVVDL